MTTLVKAENITDYIPQRSPFVMVGNLMSREDAQAKSSFLILESNIFVNDGRFTVSGLLENIAQTAAANVGYEFISKKMPVPVGFIGAISKVKVNHLPIVNSTIETTIEILQEIFDITLIGGVVRQHGEIMISCQMKIMVDKTSSQ